MKRIVGIIAGAAFAIAVLSGCSQTDNDRSNTQPDGYGEATKVTVFLNADRVPNVASFCLDNRRYSSTLASTDSGSARSPILVRVPEDDVELCGAKAR